MRNLALVAALLSLFSGSLMMTGCVSPALARARQNVAVARANVAKSKAAMETPLFKAALREDREEIFSLLAKVVEVQSSNPQGRELIGAILEGRKADALQLAASGADVNATIINSESKLYDGYTPLMLASWSDDKVLTKALVAKGADLTNDKAVGVAANSSMAKLLLDLGCPVEKEHPGGATMLSGFAIQGKTEFVRLLISRGADVEKAREFIQKQIRGLTANPEVAAAPSIQKLVGERREAIQLIERMSRPQEAAPHAVTQTAASGVTKAELAQMMKEAAAETARQAPAPVAAAPVAVVYKSDVDAPAYKASENPDAFALVVGVEKYNTLPDARFAERDAKAMNAHLLAMGYPQRNIVLLTGSQATKTGLIKNLEAWLPNNVTEKSTVMFYFSGHGAPDAKTSQAYLVPMDGDPQYLEETAYPIKRLYAKLAALKAKRVLVALDSCFSGAGGRSVLATGTRPLVAKLELAPGEGKVVSLSASSSDEITGALEEQGHGLFTYQLLKALTETAGRGTVSEVYAALKPRVQDEARRQNRAQTPQIFGKSLDGGLR